MSAQSFSGRLTTAKLSASPLLLITLALLAALLLAACGSPDAAPPDTETVPVAADTATAQPESTDTPVPEPESAPSATPPPQEEAKAESEEAPALSKTFVIVAEESEARFIIDEELFGQPQTVVGITNALSGDLTVDPANPFGQRDRPDSDRRRYLRHR